jgi:hypothetical protein
MPVQFDDRKDQPAEFRLGASFFVHLQPKSHDEPGG